MHVRPALASVLAAVALAVAPASGQAATPAQVIAALNAQRTANGIPAGIVELPDWSAKCAKHVSWMEQNNTLAHQETPGSPGYSDEGNQAGTNAVLAAGNVNWTSPARNPYLTAPFHLLQVLFPRLAGMGVHESANGAFGCHTTFPGYSRSSPAGDVLYSYPGDGKTASWQETAHEFPSVPGDAVGLPEGKTTGPNMEVFWDGAGSEAAFANPSTCADVCDPPMRNLVSATLKDAKGTSIAVKTVGHQQSSLTLIGSGFVIPVKPLKPGSSYTATATFSSGDSANRTFTDSWSFRTSKLPSPKKAVKIVASNGAGGLKAQLIGRDVYDGRTAKFTIDYGNGKLTGTAKLGGTLTATRVPKGRTAVITVKVAAFKVGSVKVPAATAAKRIKG